MKKQNLQKIKKKDSYCDLLRSQNKEMRELLNQSNKVLGK